MSRIRVEDAPPRAGKTHPFEYKFNSRAASSQWRARRAARLWRDGISLSPGSIPDSPLNTFPRRKAGGFLLRNAADRQETMRIQFATVPGSDKVLLCISEVKADVCTWRASLEAARESIGLGAVIVTDEVVLIGRDGAKPQDERCEDRLTDGGSDDLSRVYNVDYCPTCVRRPGDKWVASKDCNHA